MTEKQLYGIFAAKMKAADPSCFCYKIPDTAGLGGKRPFDLVLISGGKPFAIEFKINNGKPTRFQQWSLEKFEIAGGKSLVFAYPRMSMDNFVKKIVRLAYENI